MAMNGSVQPPEAGLSKPPLSPPRPSRWSDFPWGRQVSWGRTIPWGHRGRGHNGVLILASGLIISLTITPLAWATGRWGRVVYVNTPSGYALNSRWGPGTNFGIHTKTRRGCPLELSGVSRRGWLQLTNGTWVASNWVTSAPRERMACISITTVHTVAIVATPPGYGLNIRNGPGTGYVLVGQYVHGTRLPFTGRFNGSWTELADGQWVDGNFLQFPSGQGPSVQPIPPTPPPPDPHVQDLQRRLKLIGFLPANFAISGIYDLETQAAVREFQRVNGLPVTGVVDAATWHALYNATNPQPPLGGRQMRVNAHDAGRADVFAGPGPEYERLGTFANGTVVTTTGRVTGNWTETQGGRWIFTAWLEPI